MVTARKDSYVKGTVRLFGAVGAVAAVTAIDFRLFHVNSATAGFSLLVLILVLAARIGLLESIAASIVSVAVYNFFFLPPVGTFTIADPQNWIALFSFLATAVIASHLSASARRRAEDARARQSELQQMYDFSRGLILGKEDESFPEQIVKQIVESFHVQDAWFYDSSTDSTTTFDDTRASFTKAMLVNVAADGAARRGSDGKTLIVPVKLGGASLGSLGICGDVIPSEVALQAIAQLVAIAIERARVQAISAHIEATRQNEELKSTLLDALAHEFKTPLTSVKAATTTMLSSTLLDASVQRELTAIVDEEADRMTRLVNDSLELARMGTAPITLNTEVCSPDEIISSALDAMRGLVDGRDLKVEITPSLPLVMADKSLSELALRQILSNALKYSPVNSGIKLTSSQEGDWVKISVHNEGPGISKVDQEKIFEKFYRGRDVRSRIPGTGLGLSITREIIQSQGGVILLRSDPGGGATFSITLPIKKTAELIN